VNTILGFLLLGVFIFLFLIYSLLSRDHSKKMQENYEKFKKTYEGQYTVGFGINQDSIFAESYQIIIAVDEKHKIVKAMIDEGNTFEIKRREATEYIGLDVDEYIKEKYPEFNGNYYAPERGKLTGKERALVAAMKQVHKKI
jgi:DNA-binding transcriptional regulator of glucitol operon